MTYIDKLMGVIKFDNELLAQEEQRFLAGTIRLGLMGNTCPGEFKTLTAHGMGAAKRRYGGDLCFNDCRYCWKSEIND